MPHLEGSDNLAEPYVYLSEAMPCQETYLDTSARVNIMSTYYATQAAVRTTQAIMKAVKK